MTNAMAASPATAIGKDYGRRPAESICPSRNGTDARRYARTRLRNVTFTRSDRIR